jgi:hypothetical protein
MSATLRAAPAVDVFSVSFLLVAKLIESGVPASAIGEELGVRFRSILGEELS